MKKLIMLLVVLAATPVFALTVSMNDLGGGVIAIEYSGGDPCNLPRAFALDFTIDGPGVITLTPGSFKADGESTSTSRGFGIFPASIDINDVDGTVNSYGTPQADDADPGADPSAQHMVIELGSLYYGDVNAPATSGTLCTLTIDCNGGQDLNLTMIDELTYRGGVLTEDGAAVEVDDSIVVCAGVQEKCMKDTAAGYDNWLAAQEPDCWCYEYQPLGDLDGLEQGIGIVAKRVGSVDLGLFAPVYGKKRAQLVGDEICADLDHLDQGIGIVAKAVGSVDLAIIAGNYGKKTAQLDSSPYAADYNFWVNP